MSHELAFYMRARGNKKKPIFIVELNEYVVHKI